MKYYSEKLDKLFDTEELLKEAETQFAIAEKEKKEKELEQKREKVEAMKALDEALGKAIEATKEAYSKLADYCEKYGRDPLLVKIADMHESPTGLYDWLRNFESLNKF